MGFDQAHKNAVHAVAQGMRRGAHGVNIKEFSVRSLGGHFLQAAKGELCRLDCRKGIVYASRAGFYNIDMLYLLIQLKREISHVKLL